MNAESGRALVSVSELPQLLSDGRPPVLLDVRWQLGGPDQREAYLAAHIPGAQWCDLDRDLADPPGPGGRHPLPDPDRLQAAMRGWGIEPDSAVVVYDGANSIAAARAWWVLRWAGLSQVRVLDGGFAAWTAADQPVQTEIESPEPGAVVVRPGSLPTLDADAAARWAAAGRLVDVRAAERFRGELEPIDPVAGHIPGAVNRPTTDNVTGSGQFRSAETLRARFAELADDQPVGVYCGSGVTAAHTVLAMQQVGLDAVLYPGSWSEWITDPSRPVATGES
ncbi:MAG TPA: sulfurtransferase [Jatrophihabitans sp.]|jgi:thiosulfate/3-mercaptopyruvate sulfurtransferase|nr:sulfurtransferase [Jatrophihabitans sp.]